MRDFSRGVKAVRFSHHSDHISVCVCVYRRAFKVSPVESRDVLLYPQLRHVLYLSCIFRKFRHTRTLLFLSNYICPTFSGSVSVSPCSPSPRISCSRLTREEPHVVFCRPSGSVTFYYHHHHHHFSFVPLS